MMRSALIGLVMAQVIPAVAGEETVDRSAEYKRTAGPNSVEVLTFDWTDATRDREVPVKVYLPENTEEPAPVILVSHGLAGSRDGYEYLGRHWASHGFAAVHMQHAGSDIELRKALRPLAEMRRAAALPENHVARALDVRFVLDQLERLNREESPFAGRIDLSRVGIAGHGFGAQTALAVAGQAIANVEQGEAQFPEPRIRAAIAMNAPVPRNGARQSDDYSDIRIPFLHVIGSFPADRGDNASAAVRQLPFDLMSQADQFLCILKGADHLVFSAATPGVAERQSLYRDLIRMGSTAFWDAYLRDDARAREWLADGDFKQLLGGDGAFEKKVLARL